MKYVYTILVCIALSSSLFAQVKKARLYDADTKEPLIGATIKAGDETFQTSSNGSFVVQSNFTDIEISFTGYITKTITITDASPGVCSFWA